MSEPSAAAYRVLARKYRPATFADLIGQEAMVRTLTNAIAQGRLAHAFILTGVRGVGKTTTARIMARALNCEKGPTIEPCGVCPHCAAIAEDRHVDVIEMDAASRTGVADIRELIEGVRYRPAQARYKIYIIDEVHMLSTAAFNALLKTLEEPPQHVKFIFATTEIRKVPVTVLSRCQRFDLRRVEMADLVRHFQAIADQEGVTVEAQALELLARAADGSVRDGLSLLDQAIAHGAGRVEAEMMRAMLGLADRARTVDLLERVMTGDVKASLDQLAEAYAAGADPAIVIEDLLELVHWLTRLKVAPDLAADAGVAETERVKGGALAQSLGMASLARAWQMLLKGLAEVRTAPHPLAAAEMLLVRLAYAADLPSPAEAVQALRAQPTGPSGPQPSGGGGGGGGARALAQGGAAMAAPTPSPTPSPIAESRPTAQLAKPDPKSFLEVVALFAERREALYHAHLTASVHLVRFEPGLIEINPNQHAPKDLANKVGALLGEWTGRRWVVTVTNQAGAATLHDQEQAAVHRHPLVKAVLAAFPDAAIERVRPLADAPAAVLPALPDSLITEAGGEPASFEEDA
ncbi:MAG: DNA polymerase III subunit gamma/tau [Rhodospirillales bacterium]|nr:DNA polymerase III subunit gamma/tau [Rhodospirillales bacterium]